VRSDHEQLAEDEKAEAYGEAALSRTSTGAVTGAILGGALGAISSLLIPGFGTVLLTGILVMAAGGGIAGGFAGLISTMQLSDEEKHYYHQELQRGRSLVVVKAGPRYSEAVAILESHGAVDVTRRADAWPAAR
jgi:outer membrane lipoprotein SlyB